MTFTHRKKSPVFSRSVMGCLLLITFVFLSTHDVAAQSAFMPDNENFSNVIEQLSAGDIDNAEKMLDAFPAAAKNADYHYLRGMLATQQMNDAGAFRMARLARRMKSNFEDALDIDPDHELAHFGLLQFHRFAPGVMGGRESQLEFHQQRLIELDSFLQFPAALVRAQAEENETAAGDIYQSWIAHSPHMFEAHYGYLTSLIGWRDYEQARDTATSAFVHANEEQAQLVQYQQVRMAALAALDEDNKHGVRVTEQEWFVEAYTTGLKLLEVEPRSAEVDEAWLYMRLAQIEWALQDNERALARIDYLISQEPEERLQDEIAALRNKINEV